MQGGTGTPLSAVSVDGIFDNAGRSSSMQDGDSVEAAQAAAVGPSRDEKYAYASLRLSTQLSICTMIVQCPDCLQCLGAGWLLKEHAVGRADT